MDFYFLFDFRIGNFFSVPDHVYLWFRFLVFYKILIIPFHCNIHKLRLQFNAKAAPTQLLTRHERGGGAQEAVQHQAVRLGALFDEVCHERDGLGGRVPMAVFLRVFDAVELEHRGLLLDRKSVV